MKNQNNQNRKYFLLTVVTTIVIFTAFGSTFAQKKGAITEAEVKAYFTDWWTHDCEKSDECSVTFDSAVRIAPAVRHTFEIPPTTYLTYPVKVDMTTHKNGGTFHLQHMTHAVYYFYRNSFGDWEMGKEDERITQEKDEHQDGGTTKAPVADNQTKDSRQTNTPKTEKKTAANQNGDGHPVPDFSAMEKYFEIVRYEYPTPPEREMTIFIKPKVDFRQRMTAFHMEFRDKDGVLLQDPSVSWICCSTQLGDTETGQVGKVTVQVPSEKDIKKVLTATVTRPKDLY